MVRKALIALKTVLYDLVITIERMGRAFFRVTLVIYTVRAVREKTVKNIPISESANRNSPDRMSDTEYEKEITDMMHPANISANGKIMSTAVMMLKMSTVAIRTARITVKISKSVGEKSMRRSMKIRDGLEL